MGYQLSPIPARLYKTTDVRFYVGHKKPSGDFAGISNDDPPNDVRHWGTLRVARLAAIQYKDGGCRVDAIIRVDELGHEVYAVTEEEGIRAMLLNYGDAGCW